MNRALPKSGEILLYDFREGAQKDCSSQGSIPHSIRVVQWNIERGYQLESIIKHLQELNGDIICLQELDIQCDRTARKDVGVEIAKRLQLNYAFLCEFEELHSPLRNALLQGGGVHGNAILSKFSFRSVRCLDHKYQPFTWDTDGHTLKEPRKGNRCTIAAEIETPFGPILCYSVHLEVFCGILGRICQFSEVLADARKHQSSLPNQIIAGDLNTMAHSIARLSPTYCLDHLRWRTIGQTEAQWWQTNLLNFHDEDGNVNTNLMKYNLPQDVLVNARNTGFYDPFDIHKDITLHNKQYFGLFYGKLDWLLVRGFDVTAKGSGNHDYSASDHKSLYVDVFATNIYARKYAKQVVQRTELYFAKLLLVTIIVLLLALYVRQG